jgi:acyl carrier protein
MNKAELDQKICGIIRQRAPLQTDEVRMDADLRETYGVDSIVLVELLVEIETEFDMAFDSSALSGDVFSTAETISDYVGQKLGTSVS